MVTVCAFERFDTLHDLCDAIQDCINEYDGRMGTFVFHNVGLCTGSSYVSQRIHFWGMLTIRRWSLWDFLFGSRGKQQAQLIYITGDDWKGKSIG